MTEIEVGKYYRVIQGIHRNVLVKVTDVGGNFANCKIIATRKELKNKLGIDHRPSKRVTLHFASLEESFLFTTLGSELLSKWISVDAGLLMPTVVEFFQNHKKSDIETDAFQHLALTAHAEIFSTKEYDIVLKMARQIVRFYLMFQIQEYDDERDTYIVGSKYRVTNGEYKDMTFFVRSYLRPYDANDSSNFARIYECVNCETRHQFEIKVDYWAYTFESIDGNMTFKIDDNLEEIENE